MKPVELSPFMQTYDKLPATLPIFPLPNALVIPGGRLPLNIFEPRYLNMVSDAIKNDALIGMIQPLASASTMTISQKPETFNIGCAGRIVEYSETMDGRLEIVLGGLCRFAIKEEIDSMRGYRVIIPDWTPFENDYQQQTGPSEIAEKEFLATLKAFLIHNEMPTDWELFEKLSTTSLISSLLNVLPITTEERQLLLEADTIENRVRTFTAVLTGSSGDTPTRH